MSYLQAQTLQLVSILYVCAMHCMYIFSTHQIVTIKHTTLSKPQLPTFLFSPAAKWPCESHTPAILYLTTLSAGCNRQQSGTLSPPSPSHSPLAITSVPQVLEFQVYYKPCGVMMGEGKPYRCGLMAAGLGVIAVGLFIMVQEKPHVYGTMCALGVVMLCAGTVWSFCQCYPKVQWKQDRWDYWGITKSFEIVGW